MVGERPQGAEDLLRLIARLQEVQRGDPAKRAPCSDLLAKLLPYVEHPPPTASAASAASSPATPARGAGHPPAAGHDRNGA